MLLPWPGTSRFVGILVGCCVVALPATRQSNYLVDVTNQVKKRSYWHPCPNRPFPITTSKRHGTDSECRAPLIGTQPNHFFIPIFPIRSQELRLLKGIMIRWQLHDPSTPYSVPARRSWEILCLVPVPWTILSMLLLTNVSFGACLDMLDLLYVLVDGGWLGLYSWQDNSLGK